MFICCCLLAIPATKHLAVAKNRYLEELVQNTRSGSWKPMADIVRRAVGLKICGAKLFCLAFNYS
jgi:glutamate formiminotransferase